MRNPTRPFTASRSPLSFAVACLLSAPGLALGADEAAVESQEQAKNDVPVMVVTATRTAVDTMNAPAAVTVVDAKAIEERPGTQLTDALKTVPGLLVRDNNGAPSAWSQQVIMRGIAGYNRNAVLIDGQPLNSSFSNGVNWSVIDPQAVDRLEVVRGPFSSLYGGAAMGGVVNIVTKTPTRREREVEAGYGSNNLRTLRASYADRLGERIGLRADLSELRSAGMIEDEVIKSSFTAGAGTAVTGLDPTNTPQGAPAYRVGDKGKRGWLQQNAGVTLDLPTGDREKVILGARYHTHESEFSSFNTYLTNAATGAPVTSGNIDIGGGQRFSLRESDFLFGANGEDVTRLTAAYEREFGQGGRFKFDLLQSTNNYWYITPTSGTATAAGGTGKLVNIPNDRQTGNATVTLPLSDRQLIVTGLSLTRDTLHKREHNITDWRDPDSHWSGATTFLADAENRTWAAFLQDEITASTDLTIYAGVRYDSWTTRGDFASFVAPTYSRSFDARSKDAWSPKLSVVYTPTNDTTWRASVGDAFRSPTLSDMYSTWSVGSTIYYSNPDLKPETIRSYEIGTERRFAGGLRLSATAFHNELHDMIASASLNDGTTNKMMTNVGRAESQGLEAGLDYPFTSATRGFLNYTVTRTKVLKNDAVTDSVGKKLTLVPEEAANIGVQNTTGSFTTYVAGRYVGKMYGDSLNRDKSNGVYGSYDPYFVVDAKVGYAVNEAVNASLSVTNLLDRRYYSSTRAPERAIFADLKARF